MKKIILLLCVFFMTFSSYGQDSKFYLGVGAGYATTGGDLNSDNNYKGGLHMNFLNLGLKFNETWGITANLASAGHPIDGSDSAAGVGAFSAGPMISFPTGNATWEFKPQYAFSMAAVYRGDDAAILGLEDLTLRGSGFIIGNSIVMGAEKGFTWSIDFDYLISKFDELELSGITYDDDSKYNSLRLGVGVRYNF
ncbi:outer membrane beta-barrel protein [Flavobacteriaceae bacterium]|jgi:hypothetical protein|nr:outer membrane beta-barrel protein [Flavobacteriaceae bacterium]